MIDHTVRVYRSEQNLPRQDQLAWKIAEVATDPVAVAPEVTEMVINRIIDNAAVAVASLNRAPIVAARAQALDHPVSANGAGAALFGVEGLSSPEWRPGPTASPCASWTIMTPSWPRTTPTPGTTSPDPGRRPARRALRGRADPRHRHRL